jgi:hypothetical protein
MTIVSGARTKKDVTNTRVRDTIVVGGPEYAYIRNMSVTVSNNALSKMTSYYVTSNARTCVGVKA